MKQLMIIKGFQLQGCRQLLNGLQYFSLIKNWSEFYMGKLHDGYIR